mmetsp:Transcript_5610/g.10013  ORF Transcript_5610/g.10013 Transcript_5610/m.10013 type:complete len:238 (+) Transcript_5610:98-811(+)|eukprot:CAMPEP_0197636722 /NCGR_PEP_ID=MMETSP1338-20131121/12143_1 /TAXON_ID=43686 ORGANISM="Pelagodinium beii, Strain RCC1491" /NCGR_SAMPLE_ID=MMETSP1338 /ASSEMBLY_ACC=CAM_ASM_000754 /LENGTH=237 /DNA_ID=CAMNT_0043209011 /DNA_START=33 /DNA_END=746 /DNA_ORIENTATION=+
MVASPSSSSSFKHGELRGKGGKVRAYLEKGWRNFGANNASLLFDALKSAVPAAVLRERLNALRAEDLGVNPSDAASIRSRSGVAYQEVYGGPEMTVCIFLLRAGAWIPLHDHPGMTVFGRLLFGKMRVVSFDLLPSTRGQERVALARRRSDEIMGPEPVTYGLGPEEGNLHELQALESCAFLDVLSPPYDPDSGRDCTYYRLEGALHGDTCALVPTNAVGFGMETQAYRGPAFKPVP